MSKFKIYKFGRKKYVNKSDDKYFHVLMEQARQKVNFLESLADKFIYCGMKGIHEMARDYSYHKEHIIWPHEIMRDILSDEYGIKFRIVFDQEYVCVPIDKKNIIDFFDNNVPDYVTTVKKI